MNLKGLQLDTFLALVMVLGSAAFLGLVRMLFGWRESWALIIVSAFLVLTGFFLVDFDDTESVFGVVAK